MEYILKTDTRADEPTLFSTDKESASEYIKKIYNSEIEKIKITGDRILEKWLSDEEGHIVLGNAKNDKIEIKLMTPKKMQQFMIPFRFTVEFQAIEEYETFEEALKFAQKNIEGYKRKVKSFLNDTNLKLVDKSFGIDMNRVKGADFEYDERDFNSSSNQNKKAKLENKNIPKKASLKVTTQPSIPDRLRKFDDNNDKDIISNISSSDNFNNLINNQKNKPSDNSNKMVQPSFSNPSSTTDSKINQTAKITNPIKAGKENQPNVDEKETPNTVYGTFDKFDKFNNLDAFVKDEERKSLNKRLNTENLEKNLEKNRESKINSTIDRSFNTKRFEFDDSTLQKNQAKENEEKDKKDKKNKENKKDKVSKEKINNAKLDNDDFETTIIKPIFYMDDEFEKLKEDVNSTSDKTMIFKKTKKSIESSDELIGDDELYLTYLDKQKAEEKEERDDKKKKKRKLFGRK